MAVKTQERKKGAGKLKLIVEPPLTPCREQMRTDIFQPRRPCLLS
jgi:hypothetical protein